MSAYLNYIELNSGAITRVTEDDIDAIEEAGAIDRTLMPVAGGARGWAFNRKSGYTVTGDVGNKRSLLVLHDGTMPVAAVGVCLHQRANASTWLSLRAHAGEPLPDMPMPSPPWCALRFDVPEYVMPKWTHLWAKTVGFALLRREGW